MSSALPLLQARDLGRRLPGEERWLLRGVSMQVLPGERLAVTGPTGAGKTLLLRALAILDAIDEGEILWHGAAIADVDVPQYRREVVYLHQTPAIFEGSVEANLRRVYELSVHRGEAFDQQRVLELLGLAGRGADFLKKSATELSGGEKQITALVRAVQCAPKLLLLDEPTSALDQQTSAAVERLVRAWQEQNEARAVIWVSHDPQQVRRMATRAFALDNGAGS